MFSKSRINEPGPKAGAETDKPKMPEPATSKPSFDYSSGMPKAKPPASLLSADLTITGNLKTSGDIQVEGVIEGDIRAHLLTVGESATIKGEIVAVGNGKVLDNGEVRKLDLAVGDEVEAGRPQETELRGVTDAGYGIGSEEPGVAGAGRADGVPSGTIVGGVLPVSGIGVTETDDGDDVE